VLALAGVVAALVARSPDPGGAQPGGANGPGGASGGPSTGGAALADFVPCGEVHCPPRPQCWGGLVYRSGVVSVPRSIDCARPHYWETFAVAPLDPAAAALLQEELMARRPEVAAVCSAEVLADRSVDADATRGWKREPLPVPTGPGAWLLYCLSGPESGESSGPRFTAAG
jgi:hypothetical protein